MTEEHPGATASSDLNPFSGSLFVDPFPAYEELREAGPVVWLRSVGVWGVFRYPEVRQVVTDWQNFGSCGGGGTSNYHREEPWRPRSVVFEVNPPDHARTRAVFARVLSPKAVATLRARVADEAKRFVAAAVEKGTFDAVSDLAKLFPIKVLPDAVGLPAEGRENLLIYNAFVRKGRVHNWRSMWSEEDFAEGERISSWVAEHCRRDTLAPDGFGAQIYEAADAGDITDAEAANLIRSFLAAGVETTINGISNTIRLLMQHPAQWRLVKEDPARVRAAFEEALRFDSAIQIIARNTMQDMEFAGARMNQYDKVIAFTGSANRDPSIWENPNLYDITRKTAGHLALGSGIHGCVGQMMARMEAECLLSALVQAVDEIVPAGQPVFRTSGARGLVSLPVRVIPTQGA